MKRTTTTRTLAGAAVVGTLILTGGSLAYASGTGEDTTEERDTAITGSALDEASAAALAHTGEGTVTGTEVDDEESHYEVEVTLDNGSEVDVQLDEGFGVVGAETEGSDPQSDEQ